MAEPVNLGVSNNPARLLVRLRGESVGAILVRGASSAFVVNALGYGIQFGAQILLVRVMGAEHYGVYAYAFTWINIMVLLVTMGLDTTLLRYVAAYNAKEKWGSFQGILERSNQIVLITSVTVSGLSAGVIWFLQDHLGSELTWTFWAGCGLLPTLALLRLRQATLQSLKYVIRAKVPSAILRPFLLACFVGLVFYGWGKTAYGPKVMLAHLLATVAALVVSALWLRQILPVHLEQATPRHTTKKWLRVSLPLLLVSGMRLLLNRIDVVLVGILVGTTEAGVYIVASKIAELVAFGSMAGNTITTPLISQLYAQRKTIQLQRAVTLATQVATISSIFIGILLVLGRTIALEMFGAEFSKGSLVLLILAGGQIINACTGPVGALLNMTGHQDTNAKIIVCIVGLNILLNYPAIILWGINGAALVTSALIALKNIWTWYEVRRRVGISSSIFSSWSYKTPLKP